MLRASDSPRRSRRCSARLLLNARAEPGQMQVPQRMPRLFDQPLTGLHQRLGRMARRLPHALPCLRRRLASRRRGLRSRVADRGAEIGRRGVHLGTNVGGRVADCGTGVDGGFVDLRSDI